MICNNAIAIASFWGAVSVIAICIAATRCIYWKYGAKAEGRE